MKKEPLTRIFRFKDQDLADPNPALEPDEIRKHYVPTYAELTNASIKGPVQKDGKLVYTFTTNVGVKG